MIDKNDSRLTAYLFNELSPEEVAEVEKALAASEELRTELEALRATSKLLAAEFGNGSDLGIGAERKSAIESALKSTSEVGDDSASGADGDPEYVVTRSVPQSKGRSQWWWMAAVAAAIVVVCIPLLADFQQQMSDMASYVPTSEEWDGSASEADAKDDSQADIDETRSQSRKSAKGDENSLFFGGSGGENEAGESEARPDSSGELKTESASSERPLDELADSMAGALSDKNPANDSLREQAKTLEQGRDEGKLARGRGIGRRDVTGGRASGRAGRGGDILTAGGGAGSGEAKDLEMGGGGGGFASDGERGRSVRRGVAQQGQNQNQNRFSRSQDDPGSGNMEPAPRSRAPGSQISPNNDRGLIELEKRRLQRALQLQEDLKKSKEQSFLETPAAMEAGPPANRGGLTDQNNGSSQGRAETLANNNKPEGFEIESSNSGQRNEDAERTPAKSSLEGQLGFPEGMTIVDGKLIRKAPSQQDAARAKGSGDSRQAGGQKLSDGQAAADSPAMNQNSSSGKEADNQPARELPPSEKSDSDDLLEEAGKAGQQSDPTVAADPRQTESAEEESGSKYDFQTQTLVRPVQKFRTESRKRIVQTEEGPKEEIYSVEVPFVEQEELKLLKVQDQVASQLVQELGVQLDPAGKREIRLPPLQRFESIAEQEGKPTDVGVQFGLMVEKEIQKEALGRKLSKLEQAQSRRQIWRALQTKLDERNREVRAKRTWKRVRATPNTSRLMVGDKDELAMNGMQVNVHVEGFRARVLVDCLYYNDRGRQLEGNFKIRLPDDASLYYFAFGQSRYQYQPNLNPTPKDIANNEFNQTQRISFAPEEIRSARRESWSAVKESRMVTKEKAAFAYNQTIRRRVDPALVEWTGGGIFNARVFPLMPHKMHRIVLGYDVDLKREGDNWSLDLDLPEERGVCQVNIHVADQPGVRLETVPAIDPVVSNYLPLSSDEQRQVDTLETQLNQAVNRLGKNHPQVTKLSQQLEELRAKFAQREGGDRTWKTFTITNPEADSIGLDVLQPQHTVLRSGHEDEQQFFAFRAPVDVPAEAKKDTNQRAVFLLDTSLSSQPDKFNVWLKMLEATLENNRDSIKEFAVMYFSVDQHFWRPKYTANTADNVKLLLNDCQGVALEGATDLYSAFQRLQVAEWVASGGAGSPVVFLLSDGNANWGESNFRMLSQMVRNSQLGSVFAFQTGMSGSAIGSLRFLANETGGALFSVASEQEIAAASTAFRSRPWQIDSLDVQNGNDVLTAGRLQWLYPGQLLTVTGRVENGEQPVGAILLKLSQGDVKQTVELKPESEIPSELADRIYGQVAVEQLESLGENLVDVSAAYARNFRVTGETCSLLMLETEADYRRYNIVPKDDQIVVATRKADDLIRGVLAKNAKELSSPTAQLRAWVQRLEKMEGMQFEMPTALKLLIDEIELEPVTGTLETTFRIADLEASYLEELSSGNVDYLAATREATRRLAKSSDDAVKAVSSLVEANPGDLVLARDVAFSALEWKHPAHAFHLLRRVAESRPYEASIYPAIGNCLAELGELDAAMIFFEVGLEAKFRDVSQSYRKIVAVDYTSLLRKVAKSDLSNGLKQYASIRLKALEKKYNLPPAKIVVTMMWNTDQTDVDLHVIEPSGEECFYQHKRTRSGGEITDDVTTGFGPEMYTLRNAPNGRYQVLAKYFGDNSSRTKQRGKVYINLIRNYGLEDQTKETRTVLIQNVGEKNKVFEFEVD